MVVGLFLRSTRLLKSRMAFKKRLGISGIAFRVSAETDMRSPRAMTTMVPMKRELGA